MLDLSQQSAIPDTYYLLFPYSVDLFKSPVHCGNPPGGIQNKYTVSRGIKDILKNILTCLSNCLHLQMELYIRCLIQATLITNRLGRLGPFYLRFHPQE